MVVIAVGYRAPQQTAGVAGATPLANTQSETDTAVNEVVASSIAASVANSTNLSVAPSVTSLAISTQIESELPTADDLSISKPQIIQIAGYSRELENYTVKSGDTLEAVARKFNLKQETISWANNLTTSSLVTGSKLIILPRDGILYTVKRGDTVADLSTRYKASASSIVTFNDLEIRGLTEGLKIVIPGGTLPLDERPGYIQPYQSALVYPSLGYNRGYGNAFSGETWTIKIGTPMYSGNTYAFGNCTAYVYDRRVELGLPVGPFWGNATTWDDSAVRQGLRVSNTPSVGAIIQNEGGYGHVGIVEEILPNGDLRLSEMNAYVSGGGFNIVSGRTLPASLVSNFAYIQ